jgi:uncharacterized protein YbbC (DUF1343 family)
LERAAVRAAAGIFLGLALAAAIPAEPPVRPGVDVLRVEGAQFLEGRRLGLISNHTGKTIDGTPTLEVLRDELGLTVVALFSPEHGFSGEIAAGDAVASSRDEETSLPLYSLYGETRSPTREMLSGIDTLVFDIQDVGTRFFTYVHTMKLAMEAAEEAGIDFVVLDRPNPNGGLRVTGPMLEPAQASFVGIPGIPLLHGMTVGELALWFRAARGSDARTKLTVIRARGWKRAMLWDDTGLRWRPPSPNLPTSSSAVAYPAFGLFEGVEVSEGRGTDRPFEQAGAPFVDGTVLADRLSARGLPGVGFRPVTFAPEARPAAPRPRFEGQACHGVEVRVSDPSKFEPVRTGLAAIEEVRALYPDSFRWVKSGNRYWIDLLLGTDRPRLALDSRVGTDEILEREREAVERFLRERRSYLLY